MGCRVKKSIKFLIIITIAAGLAIFVASTDLRAAWKEINQIGYRFIWLVSVTAVAYLLGTWSWLVCLGKKRDNVSLGQLFVIRQICETVGLYNPTGIIAGDLLKIHFLKDQGIDAKDVTSSVIISRMTTVLSQILLFLIAGVWLLNSETGNQLPNLIANSLYAVLGILVLLKTMLFFWMLSNRKKLVVNNAGRSKWSQIKNDIVGALEDAKLAFRNNKNAFWLSYFFSLAHWLVGSLEFYLILRFLHFDITPMHGLLLDMSVIVFKSMGAFVPGQVGVEELGNSVMLTAIGIGSASLWVAVSLLRRARQVIWIVIGFVLYAYLKRKLVYARVD